MSDIALTLPDVVIADDWSGILVDIALGADGDLTTDDGLRTAIIISLLTDARAQDGDELPAGETDRRGWWGDALADMPGDRIGSRLWLLARETQTERTRQRAEAYAREALAWLINDKHAASIELTASFPRRGMLAIAGAAHTPNGPVPFSAEVA